ncbi:haloacid dehalogenase, type II [Exophiala spinifera]|uniref:Haloacid dehalogenase, type II n=1 Tax=Exophiala spinifera TaxID=91928 RepID=A0A0D2BK20_9EURO|nr:haloacid dehalogenase, type II [Exophiala spinifera]KIW11619.1 haloacid dehalogenase, type II [Exophiala spinifera]
MGKIVVAFDLYGTLLSTESIAKELASHFGQETAASIATVWRKYQLEYTWRLNSMSTYGPDFRNPCKAQKEQPDHADAVSAKEKYDDFFKVTRNALLHALAEHGVGLEDQALDKLMLAYDSLSTFPDVNPALERLRDNSNVECVVFSNGTHAMVTNSVNGSQDLDSSVLKGTVSIDDIRIYKPAPETYHHLARKTGKENEMDKVWLISGNPFDITGARTVGMQTAWVDRAGNGWQDRLGLGPTVVVKSLEEVAEAVERHAKSTA